MRDLSGALARAFSAHLQNRGSRGSTGSKPPNLKEINDFDENPSGTPLKTAGVPGVPEPQLAAAPAPPPVVQVARLGLADEWAAGAERLYDAPEPVKGFTPERWRDLVDDAVLFLRDHGANAAALGWTTLDLFGVHPLAPAANYGPEGLVPTICGDRVVAITAETASIEHRSGNRTTFTKRRERGVAIWALLGAGPTP